MATLADMVEEVLLNMEGLGSLQDSIGTINPTITAIAPSTTAIEVVSPQVKSGAGIIPSALEIGDELMYVLDVGYPTPPANADAIATVIRGWRGTTADTHTGTTIRVRINPLVPRIAIKRAINDTILGLYPRLPAIKTTQINYLANQCRYDLPADARNVLAVTVQDYSTPSNWNRSKRWRLMLRAGQVAPLVSLLRSVTATPAARYGLSIPPSPPRSAPIPLCSPPRDYMNGLGRLLSWVPAGVWLPSLTLPQPLAPGLPRC